MMIDTHCHLDFKDFDADRDTVVDRAKAAGVITIINVGSSIDGSLRSVELAQKYEMVYAAIGVHPHEAKSVTDKTMADFRNLARFYKVVAIGEVGLDYYRSLSPKETQIEVFKKFIGLALELDLPLILHARAAERDVLDILTHYPLPTTHNALKGVMHCFSGDAGILEKCLVLGLYVSFTCNLTFKNAGSLREVAKRVPVERLLLETDAPFLAPQAMRGKRNEPAYLTYLADEWSDILGLSKEDIMRITTHNARALFKLGEEGKGAIAYKIRDSLYLNITNRCTNACDFCIRAQTPFVKGHYLKLEKEPSVEEIMNAVGDPKRYKEIVFCGYGEPTIRMDAIKEVSSRLKKMGARIRLNTNGHGDIINSRPIVKELTGLVDKVSVSLNADTESSYNAICKPVSGAGTYRDVVDFIRACVASRIETEVTCLDNVGVNVKRCEEIAKGLGAKFRLRSLGVVG